MEIYTANASRTVQDLVVWNSVGEEPLEFKRYHNTRFTATNRTVFGTGGNWSHNYLWTMTQSGTTITLSYPNGTVNTFTPDVSNPNIWRARLGVGDILNQSGTLYTLQTKKGYRYNFYKLVDGSGNTYFQCQTYIDPTGHAYTLTYDVNNRLVQVTEPGGRFIQLTYSNLSTSTMKFIQFAKIAAAPVAGQYTEITLNTTTTYQYYRFRGADNSSCPIAEVEFYDAGNNLLTGTVFGSDPSSGSTTPDKATDGNPSTYYQPGDATGGYVGINLGSLKKAVKARFYPAAGYEATMVGGVFEGSRSSAVGISVITKVETSDGRYVTYDYQQIDDPNLPYVDQALTAAHYQDSTAASYTYASAVPSTRPLLVHSIDPRLQGTSPDMIYQYFTGAYSVIGQVQKEINGTNGDVICTIGVASGSGHQPTATYSNGRVDQFSIGINQVGRYTDGLGHKTNYTYTNGNEGFLASSTDPLNHTETYGRSVFGNLLSITYADGTTESWTRDSLDLILTHTDELGRVTTYTRDSSHRVTRIDYPDSTYEAFTFNSMGQVLTHTLRNGGVEHNTYDSQGLRQTHTDPLDNVTQYTYDTTGLLAGMTDARGLTTVYLYNDRGQPVQITRPDSNYILLDYDTFGNQTNQTNERGQTWIRTYDEFKRLTSVTDPLLRVTQYNYGIGMSGCSSCHEETHPTKITLPSGKETTITYDVMWRKTSETVGAGTADAATTTYAYDNANRLTSVTDPRGKVWSTTYDLRDRKITATDPLNFQTQWTYDAVGNVKTVKRPDLGVTTNVYDSMNRLTQITDPKSQVTKMTYDNGDNMASLVDPKGNTYTFDYDLLHRRTQFNYPGGGDFEAWSYDDDAPADSVWSVYTARDGSTMSCTYDNRGRETFCNYSDPSTPDVTKAYDEAGRLLSASTSVASHDYVYDDANQLRSETTVLAGLSPASFAVAYTYDLDGNRQSLTYPDATVVNYAYSARNQVKEIEAVGPPPLATYTYDFNGNRLTKNLENGTTTTYTYDVASRLTNIAHKKGSTNLATVGYTLNNVGNRTQKAVTGAVPARTENYTFDAVDQVTGANYGGGLNATYAYDAAGNRSSVTGSVPGTGSYTPNAKNQYTAALAQTPAYDTKGNLTGINSWTYTYDSKNRLLGASNTSVTAGIAYDYQNRPVSRTINGTTTYLVYDGWSLIAEYSSTGTLLTKYVHGPEIDEILAKIDSSGTVYYHQDGLGSTVALTNVSGSVIESCQYDVFGNPGIFDASNTAITTTAYGNRFLFTGREWLADLGLYDYRNRVYSAELGRFLQTDPIRFDGGDGNLYRYVNNQSTQNIDPYGEINSGDYDNIDCAQRCAEYCGGNSCCFNSCLQKCQNGEVPSPLDPIGPGVHPLPIPGPSMPANIVEIIIGIIKKLF